MDSSPTAYCWRAARYFPLETGHSFSTQDYCLFLFFLVLYYFHFLFIPANPRASLDFFFLIWGRGNSTLAQSTWPAEGVKSKAINERMVRLFGFVRITGTFKKMKKKIPPLSELVLHPQSQSPLKIAKTKEDILSFIYSS